MAKAKKIRNLIVGSNSRSATVNAVASASVPTVAVDKAKVLQKRLMSEETSRNFREVTARQTFERASDVLLAEVVGTGQVQQSPIQANGYGGTEFQGIRIAFEDSQTKYEWGSWLGRINGFPYQEYFRRVQTSQPVVPMGVDPLFPTSLNAPWGNVVFNIVSLEFSSRFGGCVHVILAPEEDFGAELADKNKNIYVDLHRWLLHLYVRLQASIFNTPTLTANNLPTQYYVEIEAFDTEIYTYASQRLVPHENATENDVNALIKAAETNALGRLYTLAQFVFGFIHERKLGAFNAVSDQALKIFLSDGLCAFETQSKTPYIAVKMRSNYIGTASLEGFLESDPEVTAQPWIILHERPLVLFNNRREKYIGAAQATPMMMMGYMSLTDFARVNYIVAFTSWREEDPVVDDSGSSEGFEFDVRFDLAELQNRASNNQLGKVGETLWGLQNDSDEDWLSYVVEIEFELVKL